MSTSRRKKGNKGSSNSALLLSDKTSFIVQEAYKTLRTNIMFSLPGSDCKCIGVTSPNPGDGKSTTSANLAISLAQIGKRVLLVDCDMRIPTISAKFRIPSTPGLSDFLVGQARIEDAVRKVEKYDLHILPAGNLPPDPTGLLEAKQFEHLITAVRKIYDYIIIDLPPTVTIPDAIILSKYVDGYLLVVREKQTQHRKLVDALKLMKMANGHVLGFVTTSVAFAPSRYYKKYGYYRLKK